MLFVCHSCYLTVILPTCQNYSSPDKDLMAHQDLCCPFQLPVRSMFFDMVMFLMANCKRGLPAFVMGIELNLESILMKKHLQKRFPRNPQIQLLCKVSLTTCLSPSHTSCSPPLAKFFFAELCISEAGLLVSPLKHQLYYFKFLWHNFLSLNYSYYKMNTEKVPWKKKCMYHKHVPRAWELPEKSGQNEYKRLRWYMSSRKHYLMGKKGSYI